MKKLLLVAVITAAGCLHAKAGFMHVPQVIAASFSSQLEAQRRVTYEWYNDPWYGSFTGSITSINGELTRLRNIYAGYTFSAVAGPGLYAFEWGYNPTFQAVIYSNY